jgi:hypothetical protein
MLAECLLCGGKIEVADRPWWKRLAGSPWLFGKPVMPMHPAVLGVSEKALDQCWKDWNTRLGIDDPGPRPNQGKREKR